MANPHREDDRTRLLQLVTRVGALTGLRLPVDGMLREVASTAMTLTHASGTVLAIRTGDQLVYRAAAGRLEAHIGLELPAEGSLSGYAMGHRELAYSGDTLDDPRVHAERARETGARSMLVAPLLHGPDAIGVLKVICDRPDAFDEIDEHAAQLCAQFASGVLARQQAVDERDRLLAEHRQDLVALQTILDTTPACILVHDLDGKVRYWSAGAERILGWSASETVGRLPPFVADGEMTSFLDLSRRIVKGEAGALGTFVRQRKDGSDVRLRVRGAPIREPDGTVTAVVRVLEPVDE